MKNINNIQNGTRQGSIYKTTDGIIVDDNDADSIVIYRPLSEYMTLDDVKKIDQKELPHIEQDSIILKKDEYCCYVDKGYTFEEKTITTGYAGKSSGYSIKVTKGITYRKGRSEGVPIKETKTSINPGMLYLTNKRIIFKSAGKDSFDKTIDKISSIDEGIDCIEVQIGTKVYQIALKSHTLFMITLGLIKNKEFGTELPDALRNNNVQFTSDPYVLEMTNKEQKESNIEKNQWKPVKISLILLGIVLMIMMILTVQNSKPTGKKFNLTLEKYGLPKELSMETSLIIEEFKLKSINGVDKFSQEDINASEGIDYDQAYKIRAKCESCDSWNSHYLHFYYKNKKVIYVCSSNHVVNYYKDGKVIDSPRWYHN